MRCVRTPLRRSGAMAGGAAPVGGLEATPFVQLLAFPAEASAGLQYRVSTRKRLFLSGGWTQERPDMCAYGGP
jgi:hypothetical protein